MEDVVAYLNSNLLTLLDIHALYKTARITKTYAPWLTNGIRDLIGLRNKALANLKKVDNRNIGTIANNLETWSTRQ